MQFVFQARRWTKHHWIPWLPAFKEAMSGDDIT